MNNRALAEQFAELSMPLIADAAVRLRLPFHLAPFGIQALIPGSRLAGRALPAKHFGSVDVFLEAMESAEAGDILVIDNNGRTDEGCERPTLFRIYATVIDRRYRRGIIARADPICHARRRTRATLQRAKRDRRACAATSFAALQSPGQSSLYTYTVIRICITCERETEAKWRGGISI